MEPGAFPHAVQVLGLRTVPVIDGLTDGSDGQLPVSVWTWGTPVFIRHMTAVTAVRRVQGGVGIIKKDLGSIFL